MKNMQHEELYQEEVIDLRDIWQKLIAYKKVFWSIFLAVLIIGSVLIYLTPPKYKFSQVIYLAKAPDENGKNTLDLTAKDYISKIQKIFVDNAVRAYNATVGQKARAGSVKILVQEVGGDSLLLSIDGKLKNQQMYSFIFNYIAQDINNYNKDIIEHHKSSLTEAKVDLEQGLQVIKRGVTDEYSARSRQDSKNKLSLTESRIAGMYLNDQNLTMKKLIEKIAVLKIQIASTCNSKAETGLIISDEPIQSSKLALRILIVFIALFSAFFGVFTANFISSLSRVREKK